MEGGGPGAALDAFLRFAFRDAIVDRWTPDLRARMLADAAMVFSIELPAFQAYRPDDERLGACRVPVSVLVGEDEQAPFFHEAAQWLADRLGTSVGSAPGAHGAHFSHPVELADAVRNVEVADTVR
jgi:pimeloyl-ACP methyl ester carboxylesterase